MEKRILLLCKDRNAKIMTILGDQDPSEVMEFQTTIQMVQVVVNRLLVSGGKKQILIDVPLLDKIYTILGQYEELLEQYIASGRLRRLLNSNRMRRKLEKINSDLHVHLKEFVETLKEMNAKQSIPSSGSRSREDASVTELEDRVTSSGSISARKKEKSDKREIKKSKEKADGAKGQGKKDDGNDKKKNKKNKEDRDKKKEKKVKKDKSPKKSGTGVTSTGGAAAGDDKEKREASEKRTGDVISSEMSASRKKYTSIVDVAGKELAEEHQHLRHLSNEMISDPEGKDFWLKLFGAEAFYVKWDEFIEELSKALGVSISKDDQALMKHVLDNSGTGHINMYKWSEFLKGFGPLTNVVNNVRNILTAPWFHGFLTSREAELLLEDQPIGTFLIRFSRSSGGSFALAFVQEHRKILHILIQSCMPEGFKIDEEEGDKSKYFESLQDIVDHYSIFLQHSFTSELPRESWFHGDVSPPEAIELLQGHPEGTFLIRFSSQPGCFAASFMASHSEVRHALIQGLPQGGFLFAGEKETFPNLTTLIEAYSPTLRFALPNNETDVAPILKKYLESKKAMKEAEDRGPIPNHYSAVDTETFKKVLGGRK